MFDQDLERRKQQFVSDGFVVLDRIFDDGEVAFILDAIRSSKEMERHRKLVEEKYRAGKYPSFDTIFVMNDVFSDNVFSLACRKAQIPDFISAAFDDDAYLYHAKVPLKYPGMPGFKYHQDYFYWYRMGCLFPKMATCFIALEHTDANNGCLKFIPKSHTCGRIDHVEHDGVSDSEADPGRVAALKSRFGEVEIAMEPGQVAIFHSNLLHSSGTNNSTKSRLALLGCFNTKGNSPLQNASGHPGYGYQPRFSGVIGPKSVRVEVDLTAFFDGSPVD